MSQDETKGFKGSNNFYHLLEQKEKPCHWTVLTRGSLVVQRLHSYHISTKDQLNKLVQCVTHTKN